MRIIFNISNKELERIDKYSKRIATTKNPLGKELNYARLIMKDLLNYIKTLNLRIESLEEAQMTDVNYNLLRSQRLLGIIK